MLQPPDFSPTRRSSLLSPTKQVMCRMPVDYLRQDLSSKKDIDPVFGIYNEGSNFKIGSRPIKIDGDDIYIDGDEGGK